MIEITPTLSLNESELQFDFVRSPGPGGQNVNKVATSVQLRFDVLDSPSLPADVKARLVSCAGRRMTAGGILIITARRFRTQDQNRLDAAQRLVALIQKALVKPSPRKATRPSAAARAARLSTKRRRAATKRDRHHLPEDLE